MTSFNHVSNIGQRDAFASLEDNLKSFLDWSFLNIGGFVNVSIPVNPTNPGYHQLIPLSGDPSLAYGKEWGTLRKDWVYETGINYENTSPSPISGIIVNGTFLPAPTGSGNYGYYIDHTNGRIIFDKNISVSSKVYLNYSYRLLQVYKSSENFWWKEIEANNYNPSTVLFKTPNYTANSIQLPAIVIQTASRSQLIPYELGTTENILRQDVLLHVFSELSSQRNNFIDILLKQKDNSFYLYDINKVIKNQSQPLNFRGEANPSRLNYDQIVNDTELMLKKAFIFNSTLSEIQSFTNSLHHGVVRWTIEIFP